MRIETVVLVHRVMAVFMALYWYSLLSGCGRDCYNRGGNSGNGECRQPSRFYPTRKHQRRNEMAMLGTALNNMSAELAEVMPYLSSGFRRKPPGWSIKTDPLFFMAGQPPIAFPRPAVERLSPVLNGLQNLTLLRDIDCGCMTLMMKRIIRSLPASQNDL